MEWGAPPRQQGSLSAAGDALWGSSAWMWGLAPLEQGLVMSGSLLPPAAPAPFTPVGDKARVWNPKGSSGTAREGVVVGRGRTGEGKAWKKQPPL